MDKQNGHRQHWLRGMLACCRMRSRVPGRDSSALASWLNITARLAASPSAVSSWAVPTSGGACFASAERYLSALRTSISVKRMKEKRRPAGADLTAI